ncbi:hypothetical protein [Culturomica massiliensis]|jgi:hypothetical protein|uniref:hypothetical protein n=1 Tax=Culturomica massiliensis TaxID=1841857 RepID=UPI000E55ED2A|nr:MULTISPECIES: hypothetical protein [Odoribacteraceae]RHV89628.1 hypothetical protein DXA95_15880 [Odoribacter sp. OF09-27XD]
MIIKRQTQDNKIFAVFKNSILIINDKVEKKLPQMPFKDIAILLSSNMENLKEYYQGIKETYDYQIVKLLMNMSMIGVNYFESYHFASFDSAFHIRVNYNSSKTNWSDNPDFLPIQLAALILGISEERMLNLTRLDEKEYKEEDGESYISCSDFIDYWSDVLKDNGHEVNINLLRQENQICVLIERELTDNTMR